VLRKAEMLEKELMELKKSSKQREKEWEDRTRNLTGELEQSQALMKRLQDSTRLLEDENDKLISRERQLSASISTLQSESDGTMESLAFATSELEELKSTHAATVRHLEGQNSELTDEVEFLKRQTISDAEMAVLDSVLSRMEAMDSKLVDMVEASVN